MVDDIIRGRPEHGRGGERLLTREDAAAPAAVETRRYAALGGCRPVGTAWSHRLLFPARLCCSEVDGGRGLDVFRVHGWR